MIRGRATSVRKSKVEASDRWKLVGQILVSLDLVFFVVFFVDTDGVRRRLELNRLYQVDVIISGQRFYPEVLGRGRERNSYTTGLTPA